MRCEWIVNVNRENLYMRTVGSDPNRTADKRSTEITTALMRRNRQISQHNWREEVCRDRNRTGEKSQHWRARQGTQRSQPHCPEEANRDRNLTDMMGRVRQISQPHWREEVLGNLNYYGEKRCAEIPTRVVT